MLEDIKLTSSSKFLIINFSSIKSLLKSQDVIKKKNSSNSGNLISIKNII